MVSLYLDDCINDTELVRQLRGAGLTVYRTTDLTMEGRSDDAHLEKATSLGAVLVSQNQKDFKPLHGLWEEAGQAHAGMLLTEQVSVGAKVVRLKRAARLLTPEAARNQVMYLKQFDTEEGGQLFVLSLRTGQ